MATQIIRIGRELRQNLLLYDRARNVPRRIEQDVVYRRLKLGCLLIGLADNDPRRKYRLVVAKELKARDRRIYDDAIGRNDPGEPPQPLEIDRQLPQPLFRRRLRLDGPAFGLFPAIRMCRGSLLEHSAV